MPNVSWEQKQREAHIQILHLSLGSLAINRQALELTKDKNFSVAIGKIDELIVELKKQLEVCNAKHD